MPSASVRGYLVHLYTASTLGFAVLAIQWILAGRYAAALLAMAGAVAIDATDGALARKHRVAETAPRIDGPLLDNLVDFTTYVVVPVVFLLHAGLLVVPAAAFATLLAMAAAFGFTRSDAKQGDAGFFAGFPSYWNVLVCYAFLLELTPAVTSGLVVGLALLTFADVRFLYVSRLPRGRRLHLVLGGAWGAALAAALLAGPGPTRDTLSVGSLAYVAVYLLHSVWLDRRSRRRATPPPLAAGLDD